MSDLVSIIVPTYNKLDFLKQMMDSVELNTDWPFELIVVDNGSGDGTKEFILGSNYKMKGNYLRNEENKGFAVANNQGIEIANGSFICLLNNDTIVTKSWLTAMMNVFSEEKGIGVVGAKLVHPGKGTIQHAGVVELSSGVPDHIYFDKQMNYAQANIRKEYFAVTGACMLIPKNILDEVGGLDSEYVNGWEDIDLCQKIRKLGYRIFYEPTALVYHYESRTDGRYSKENHNFNLYMSRYVFNR